MIVIERTCPGCRGEGKLTGDGGGMDGGGNYHHPPCATCDDEGQVVPAHVYRAALHALRDAGFLTLPDNGPDRIVSAAATIRTALGTQ